MAFANHTTTLYYNRLLVFIAHKPDHKFLGSLIKSTIFSVKKKTLLEAEKTAEASQVQNCCCLESPGISMWLISIHDLINHGEKQVASRTSISTSRWISSAYCSQSQVIVNISEAIRYRYSGPQRRLAVLLLRCIHMNGSISAELHA